MKNLLIYILALATFFSGCKKETEELFDKPVDERITETLNAYQVALVQAPGWKLFVYPEGLQSQGIEVGGLTYYVKFNDMNRVTMVSDFFFPFALTPKESGYRLKATQRPSLIFDTYSYIHAAADPDPNVSFSPTNSGGYGWGTDFNFSFTQATPGDTIILEGNFNGSDGVLIKATEEEINAAFNQELAYIMSVTDDYTSSNSFLYFPGTDNTSIGISLNLFLYIINFNYLSGGDLITISAPFSHTTYGLHFKNPITVGGYTFQDAYWDDALKVYYINVGNTRVNIVNSATPLFPFNTVIGKSITTISVPTTALPGQSALFKTQYSAVKISLKTGPYNLDLQTMDFIFDDASKIMALNANVQQNGVNFVAQYVYTYTLDNSNIAKFERVAENGNGNLVENSMRPLLDYIEQDQFKLDYFTGSGPVLGQFVSQDNPAFFFTGNLQ
jgi:hypothetical protein